MNSIERNTNPESLRDEDIVTVVISQRSEMSTSDVAQNSQNNQDAGQHFQKNIQRN